MKKYLKNNRHVFIFLVLVSAIYGGLTAIIPITSGKMIDAVNVSGKIGTDSIKSFFFICVVLLFLVLSFGFILAKLKSSFIRRVRAEIETDLFSRALETNIAPTTLINMFCVEVDLVIENYYTSLNEIAVIIMPFIIALVYTVKLSWLLIIGIAAAFIVVMLLNQVLLAPFSKYMESLSKNNELVNKALVGFLNAATSLRIYGGLGYAVRHISNVLIKRNKLETEKAIYGVFIESVNTLFSALMQIIPLAIIAIMIVKGRLSIGEALSIMLLFEKIVSPIDRISRLREKFAETDSYRKRLANVIADDIDDHAPKYRKALLSKQENLLVNELVVKIQDKTIISGFNAFFEMGKKYLLIGSNGSGKSTLFKILTKQVEEYEGDVIVSDKELRDVGAQEIFEMIGIIPQNLEIFDDTIENNIVLGREADYSKLRRALEQAGLPEERLNEYVSENLSNFSGGELQRIALARMFYNPKRIYLLDEVTSGLEYGLAKVIEKIILSIPDGMIIHISHRSDEELISKYDATIDMNQENKALRLYS